MSVLTLNIILYDENKKISLSISSDSTIDEFILEICKINFQLAPEYTALYKDSTKLKRFISLKDQGIKANDTITQKKNDLSDVPGLIISYEPDIIYGEYTDNKERAVMPCGHVISRESMTDFLTNLLNDRKYVIECPGIINKNKICKEKWDFALCAKIGVLSQKEKKEFEIGFARLMILDKMNGKICPTCDCFVFKPEEVKINRVACIVCAKKGKAKDFCWKCLKPWNNLFDNDFCGNDSCKKAMEETLNLLKNCSKKKIGEVENVPEIRACPQCKTLISHKSHCKHMKCKKCYEFEFCFVCLSVKNKDNTWPCGKYNDICKVAPIQNF